MGIISSFQRHYLDIDKTDLNICTHTFGTVAITVVMEQFRKYYLLVEKEAIKLQTEDEDNKKAMRLMPQLIKFYKFYYLLYLNKRWLNSQ